MYKPKVIIYGLGKQWKLRKKYLEQTFDILAYSDIRVIDMNGYIEPAELTRYRFDYVYITSVQYFQEIKEELIEKYDVKENKIIGEKDTCWYIDNSLTRDKWVKEKLKEIAKGKTLLDAGAGELRYKKYCSHLNYISQDFGQYDGTGDWGGLQIEGWDTSKVDIISDITDIPLENNSVDAILCTEVFEHIKNPLLALQEFCRICKEGGVLLLTAPFCSLTHFAPFYFANGFSTYWYQEVLPDYGFEILEMEANGNYFDYLRQELLRLPEAACKYCKSDIDFKDMNDVVMDNVRLLEILSQKDKGSDELLCFGYMVKAVKRG